MKRLALELFAAALKSCTTFAEASIFSPPASIRHLVGTVEHAHQGLLIIDARERDDNGRVRDDQIQVVFGEVKVGCLKSQF